MFKPGRIDVNRSKRCCCQQTGCHRIVRSGALRGPDRGAASIHAAAIHVCGAISLTRSDRPGSDQSGPQLGKKGQGIVALNSAPLAGAHCCEGEPIKNASRRNKGIVRSKQYVLRTSERTGR
jgi:hypothetical protein